MTFNLEARTLDYARRIKSFVTTIKLNFSNETICKQLLRSSFAIGANYIEANDSLGRKDFLMRIKIARKEAKESRYWLLLLRTDSTDNTLEGFIDEATQLVRILSSIIYKFERPDKH